MNDVRDILAKALPETPPAMSIDRDKAITAGRRARTRRTWLVAAAAGLSTLVVGAGAAGAVTWQQGNRAQSQIGDVGAPASTPAPSVLPTPTPDAPTQPPPTPTTSQDPVAPTSVRNRNPAVTAALRAAMTQVAPTVVSKPVKEAYSGGTVDPFELLASEGLLKAWAELSDSEGQGYVFVTLEKLDFATVAARFALGCQVGTPGLACTTRTGPGGELIWIQQGVPTGATITVYIVEVTKPDGTSVSATVDNYSHDDQSTTGNPHPQRPAPPLSVEQTIALLLAPGVTLTP